MVPFQPYIIIPFGDYVLLDLLLSYTRPNVEHEFLYQRYLKHYLIDKSYHLYLITIERYWLLYMRPDKHTGFTTPGK